MMLKSWSKVVLKTQNNSDLSKSLDATPTFQPIPLWNEYSFDKKSRFQNKAAYSFDDNTTAKNENSNINCNNNDNK